MGDFGEGPLGTKLGQGATAVKYPKAARVKNKTTAPTQVRAAPRRPSKFKRRRRLQTSPTTVDKPLPRISRSPPPPSSRPRARTTD
jgi:hypothetical protein